MHAKFQWNHHSGFGCNSTNKILTGTRTPQVGCVASQIFNCQWKGKERKESTTKNMKAKNACLCALHFFLFFK